MNILKKILKNITYKQYIAYTLLALLFAGSMIFVNNNHFLYDRPIAEVTDATIEEQSETVDRYGNEDQLFSQRLAAEVKNGEMQGQLIHLTNEYSSSRADDHRFDVGDELFISINADTLEDEEVMGSINDVKRDTYLMFVAWVFILTLLLVGKKQGLFSLISLVVNAVLLSFALDIYMNTAQVGLLFICSVLAVLFTVISLFFVNGFNPKTYAAIIVTLLAITFSMVLTYFAMWITAENGLYYEAMQFLTRPPQAVFMAGILIGSLGAVMDVAITISSSIFNLYEKNNQISTKALMDSGLEIGKDIMGTMTNILFFVYVSGSIPVLILYLNNQAMFGYTLSINLSLELARALAGGIGIVMTIPIGLYITTFFVNRKRGRS